MVKTAMAMPLGQQDERAVIEAIRRGDRYALSELVERQSRWVRGLVYAQLGDAHLVDDVVQGVWLRVWERVGTLRDLRTWRSWLAQLARNAAYDALRERRRERAVRVEAGAKRARRATDNELETPDAAAASGEERSAVLAALRALPAMYREVVVLRHLEGWGYREIGSVLGLSEAAVETRLVRARRQLRAALAGA
jgi:RNA polymerase sigma factor (sigma-70 family)